MVGPQRSPWVMKGHRATPTNCSTCTILLPRVWNICKICSTLLLSSCFVTKKTMPVQHWHYFISVCNHSPGSTQPGHPCMSRRYCANSYEMEIYNLNYFWITCVMFWYKNIYFPSRTGIILPQCVSNHLGQLSLAIPLWVGGGTVYHLSLIHIWRCRRRG